MTNKEYRGVINFAKERGYHISCDGSRMVNRQGDWLKPTQSGGAWITKGSSSVYDSLGNLKKSSKWG